jgi:FkbM family methyltransferase
MSLASAERRVEAALARTPLASLVEPRRAVRFVEYLAVGASGAVLDVGLTASTIGHVHYVLANAIGFLVANTWNFGLNRRFTFGAEGSIARQYPAYLAWHVATFAVRAAVLTGLIELAGAPVLVASVVGIGAATIANFTGSERIFGTTTASPEDLRVSAGRAVNRLAHALYTERVRDFVVRTGLYAPLYGAYQRVLGWLYSEDVLDVDAGGASARVHMENDAEVLSVLHTLRKEGDMIDDFAASIEADDVVWDVGANLGVFSLLAADRAVDGRVVAFEPFEPTARRLQENVELSDPAAPVDVVDVALWNETGWTEIGIDRAELGTQTPTLDPRPGQEVIEAVQVVGDELVDEDQQPAPDVLKVDVEGAELPVLDGLERTLNDCRLVYVEDHSALWGGEDAGDELRERLEDHGLDVDVERQGGQTYYRGER